MRDSDNTAAGGVGDGAAVACGKDGKTTSRRDMLRRSLGTAAPVVLTLSSAPVLAGQCVSASGFVSASTFQSRKPGVLPCAGHPPSYWRSLGAWPKAQLGGVSPNSQFHKVFGNHSFVTSGFNGSTKLRDVLETNTPEGYITAALLNAYNGGMFSPFDTPESVYAIWSNIVHNRGIYVLDNSASPAMTADGTMDWIAMTWE